MKNKQILNFDFDGVFIKLNGNWQKNPEKYKDMKLLDGAKDGIDRLKEQFEIFVQSARFNPDINHNYLYHMGMVKSFLEKNDINIKPDNITAYKQISVLNIDDFGYKFTTWKRLMHDIKNMEI